MVANLSKLQEKLPCKSKHPLERSLLAAMLGHLAPTACDEHTPALLYLLRMERDQLMNATEHHAALRVARAWAQGFCCIAFPAMHCLELVNTSFSLWYYALRVLCTIQQSVAVHQLHLAHGTNVWGPSASKKAAVESFVAPSPITSASSVSVSTSSAHGLKVGTGQLLQTSRLCRLALHSLLLAVWLR